MGGKSRQPKKSVTVGWAQEENSWRVEPKGIAELTVNLLFFIKQDAVKNGRDVAKKYSAELVVKNKNGTISYRNSYGRDAKHRPG